jgi:ABC-type glycerol-3-phosphate transport system substrate-binding protein
MPPASRSCSKTNRGELAASSGWRGRAASLALLLLIAGCRPEAASPPAAEPTAAKIPVRLGVVDDEQLAEALGRLRGEWRAEAGSELVVEQIRGDELSTRGRDYSVLIVPSHTVGELAERGAIAPPSAEVLAAPGLAWSELLANLRDREVVWGGSAQGVPLGSNVLMCWYRADLLRALGRRPPRSWDEYAEVAGLLNDRANLKDRAPPVDQPWCGTLEPTAPGSAGLLLLARAASYAKHPSQYSALFRIDTLEPLIAGPPFVRALEELTAAARLCGASSAATVDDVRVRFLRGECGMAIFWPGRPRAEAPPSGPELEIDVALLPGSRTVYEANRGVWEDTPRSALRPVSFLGAAGRVAVVTKEAARPDDAWRLVAWLSARLGQPSYVAGAPRATCEADAMARRRPITGRDQVRLGDGSGANLDRRPLRPHDPRLRGLFAGPG